MGMLEAQEVATCCRMGAALMGGREGPRFAQVSMDTLFVRDADFMTDLARDLARDVGSVYATLWHLVRDNREANEENAARRRARSEAVQIASDLVDVMRSIRKKHPERWRMFQKMIGKQTLRKIVRGSKDRDSRSIRLDVEWCAAEIERAVGGARLEKLLTLRNEMA